MQRRGARTTGALLAAAGLAGHAHAQAADVAPAPPSTVPAVVVRGNREDTRPKLDHILPEVAGTRITVTKKSDVAKLDQAPAVLPVVEAPRQLFAHTPGLLVSEQQTLTQFNFNYRGLGDPNASESVLVLQDGIPIAADWIGAPVLASLPLAPGLGEVQLVRAGSGLLYGPQSATINLVSRRPAAGAAPGGSVEAIGGSDRSFSGYGDVQGSAGRWDYRAALGYVRTDGERRNAGSRVGEGDLYLGFRPDARGLWYLDAKLYEARSGDPGRIGQAQFDGDPTFASTPFNADWVNRYALTLGNETDLGGGRKFEGKLWYAYEDLTSRIAAQQLPGAPPPAGTTLQDALYRSEGVDLRLVQRWGRGNALTVGAVAYHDDAPLRQWSDPDLVVARNDHGGTPLLRQARESDYAAVFAENVFRLPHRIHVVPSVRLEHERVSVDEGRLPPTLTRPPVDAAVDPTTPLFGLGVGNDFGRDNETYFSVTQGYRPVRFLDVASPYSDRTGLSARPSRSVDWEAGVHGTPLKGLFYDAGLFWVEVRDRVETLALSPVAAIPHVTGDTRHRGFEGEVSYDWSPFRGPGRLRAFANLSLLDARFTASATPGQVGKVPAYAPHVLARYGLVWREPGRFEASVAAVSVSAQYWQDSNAPAASPQGFVPARIPAYTVADLDLGWNLSPKLKLMLAITNLADTRYTSRVYQDGVEPAPGRQIYAGLRRTF